MKRQRGNGILEILLTLGLIALIAAFTVPNYMRSKSRQSLIACKSNLKNIGTALELYATDWSTHYPPSTAQLTPDYLKTIPTCGGAGEDSYSPSYTKVYHDYLSVTCPLHDLKTDQGDEGRVVPCNERKDKLTTSLKDKTELPKDLSHLAPELTHCPEGPLFEHLGQWETFTICCGGENHPPNTAENYPQYNPMDGLIESQRR